MNVFKVKLAAGAAFGLAALAMALWQAPAWAACGAGIPANLTVYAGGTLDIGNNAEISGREFMHWHTSDGKGVTSSGSTTSQAISFPALPDNSFPTGTTNITGSSVTVAPGTYNTVNISNATFSGGVYNMNSLTLGGNITLGAGTYNVKTAVIYNNNTVVTVTGPVTINIQGPATGGTAFDAGNNTATNQNGSAANLNINIYGITPNPHNYRWSGFVSASSNTKFVGSVYSPNANVDLTLRNVGEYRGAFITAGNVTVWNNAEVGYGAPNVPGSIVDHYHFTVNTSASTCSALPVTIVAHDANHNPVSTICSNNGTIAITTSSSHGDWAVATGGGAFNNGAADDGAATYTYVSGGSGGGDEDENGDDENCNNEQGQHDGEHCGSGDNGSVTLNLTNHHADNLTITASDGTTASTSSQISFRDNAFVITNNAVQVAGKPQAMSVAMWRRSGNDCAIAPGYGGSRSIKAWVARDGDDPTGTAPSISGASLSNSVPLFNNVTLSFSNGQASFNLDTSDVGKYSLNLLDSSRTFATGVDISGNSPVITTRPFALAIPDVRQGSTVNPANSGAAGSVFAKAGTAFQATVGAYRWNSAADANNDGVPDGGATLAQITTNGLTPSYRWPTTLAAAATITPAGGVMGVLSGGALASGAFSGGSATPANLGYSEVGSFTMTAAATNFLNTSGVNLSAYANPVVGRFIPDHFSVSAPAIANRSGLPAGAPASVFTYMGEPMRATFTLTAQDANNNTTQNYSDTFAKLNLVLPASFSFGAINNAAAKTPLTARVSVAATAGSWVSGVASVNATLSLTRNNAAPDGPYDAIDIGIAPLDSDAVGLAAKNLDADNNSINERALLGRTQVRFGRLRLGNAYGPELQRLSVPVEAQFWNGATFATNTLDNGTALTAANIVLSNYQKNLQAGETVAAAGGYFTAGRGVLRLSAPGANNNGSVDLCVDLDTTGGGGDGSCAATTGAAMTYLQGLCAQPVCRPSTSYSYDPFARATFGIFKSEHIYIRENY